MKPNSNSENAYRIHDKNKKDDNNKDININKSKDNNKNREDCSQIRSEERR